MKKKLSLLMVALVAVAAFAASVTWKVTTDETSIAAETTLLDDDVLTVKTVYESTRSDATITIAGEEFDKYFQVRVNAWPSASNVTGTEQSGSTPVVVTAKEDCDLTIYYRRQSTAQTDNKGTYAENDGKDLLVKKQSDLSNLTGTFTVDSETADGKYGYATKKVSLTKGETYTLCAKGTTIQFFGVTYETTDATEEPGGETGEVKWVKTDPSELASDDVIVYVNQVNSEAMSNDNGTSKAPAAVAVTLSSDNSEITGEVAANIQWVVTRDGDNYKFGVAGTENYVYCTNTNNGVRVGDNANNVFTIKTGGDNDGYYLLNTATTRYLGEYIQQDWRCYTSINTNIKVNNNAFYKKVVTSTEEPAGPEDIEISPASGDIAQALTEAAEGKTVKDITINLTAGGAYTISASLVAPNSITINGNGATIDASALEAAMITTPAGDLEEWMKGSLTVKDVTIKGLTKSLYASAGKNYLYENFLIENSVVEFNETSGLEFDFRKGGVAKNFTINNSTLYAVSATSNSLYTSQSAQKGTEAPDVTVQTFAITNSTLVNFAKSKNFFTHRQANQTWLAYTIENSIFVNCGKSGQVVKGINQGQNGKNPTWTIVGNVFNFDGADTSAAEDTGDADEPVKDNVAGVVTFTEAATGNFNGSFVGSEGAFVPADMPGDPRWTIEHTATTVPAPKIDGQEMFINTQNITLSDELEGVKVYYTTDGAEPTAESTAYTEPIEIKETTTVKAIAAYTFAGKDYVSEVATATFTLQTTFATIAELKQLADGAGFGYTGEALVVAQAKAGSDAYTYITDETGAAVIVDKDGANTPADAKGKTIVKDWVGNVSTSQNLFALVPVAALTLNDGEAQAVEYPVVDFEYLTAEHVNEVVTLSGVTYAMVNNEDINITTIDGATTLTAYNKFGLPASFPTKDVEYNVVGAIGADGKFWPIEFVEKPTEDIVVDVESGDITAAIAEASKGHFVRNITINLKADGEFTITKSIEAAANIIINGNGATVDASGIAEGAFILMSQTPAVEANASNAYIVDNVTLKDVTINNLKGSLFYDNKVKYGVADFTIDNVLIQLTEEAVNYEAIIAFEGGGTKAFTIKNSTVYGNENNKSKYFFRYGGQGRMDRLGYDKNTEIQSWTYTNNTFYNVLKSDGQWGNGQNGQSYMAYYVDNNIWFNCGAANQSILTRLGFGRIATEHKSFTKNTFFNGDKDNSVKETLEDDALTTNPYFKGLWDEEATDAEKFAIDAASAQATNGTGDPRWGTWAPKHYSITVAETAKAFADITVQADAIEGETVAVAVKENNGFKLTELIAKVSEKTKLSVEDNKTFVMGPANVTIDATFDRVAADYEFTLAADGDIDATLENLLIRNLKLTLAEGATYKVTKPITLGGTLEIDGQGATIDASGITAGEGEAAAAAPLVILSGSETFAKKADDTDSDHYLIASAVIKNVTVTGLQDALIKDNQKTLLETLTIENANIEMPAAAKNVIDFNGKGYVGAVVVSKSTIWANGKNTGFFAQYGSRPKNVNGDWLQTFDVQNSTIVNIANGKNFCDLKQNGTAQNGYTLKNNIFADCGKSGQTVVGFNKGQASATPAWDVDGNLFLLNGANNNAAEESKAGNDAEGNAIVKNSVDATITFEDAAKGDFHWKYVKNPSLETMPEVGDPRWLPATEDAVAYAIEIDEAIENGTVTASAAYSPADATIKLTITPADGYELDVITVTMGRGKTEIEVDEDNSFIMPAANVQVTATFKEAATGIQGVRAEKLENAVIYNLQGQRVDKSQARGGMFIVNGRKVVLK